MTPYSTSTSLTLPHIPPMDPRAAAEYVKKHKLMELFQILGAQLVYRQPEDVNSFLVEEIQRLKEERDNSKAESFVFFSEEEYVTMFGLLDVVNNGYISKEQYLAAFASLNNTPLHGSGSEGSGNAAGKEARAGLALESNAKIDAQMFAKLM